MKKINATQTLKFVIGMSRKHCGLSAFSLFPTRVPRDSVVRCLTRNPGVLGSSCTESSGFFSWARHFRAQPSISETQESMNNVSCRRDMTEIQLKAA